MQAGGSHRHPEGVGCNSRGEGGGERGQCPGTPEFPPVGLAGLLQSAAQLCPIFHLFYIHALCRGDFGVISARGGVSSPIPLMWARPCDLL